MFPERQPQLLFKKGNNFYKIILEFIANQLSLCK